MTTKEEAMRFLSNPANRLLIDLNTAKKEYKNIFKEMDKVKNIDYFKTFKIVMKYESSKYKIATEEEYNKAFDSISELADYFLHIYKWKKWKKIYSFNDTLISTLSIQADKTNVDELVIPKNFLQNIPYESFFIHAEDFMDDILEENGDDQVVIKGFYVTIDTEYGTKRKVLSFNVPLNQGYHNISDDMVNVYSYEGGPIYSWNYEIVLDADNIGDCIQLAIDNISKHSLARRDDVDSLKLCIKK